MALTREFDFALSATHRGGIFGAWVMVNLTSKLPLLQFTFKGDLVTHSSNILYYIHDPMCSWCWGFRPVWQQLKSQFTHTLDIVYVVGGLAPDSDQPMPLAMQNNLSNTWQHIQQHIPGIEFNYEFWNPASNSMPRRSTYPARLPGYFSCQSTGRQYGGRYDFRHPTGLLLKRQKPLQRRCSV